MGVVLDKFIAFSCIYSLDEKKKTVLKMMMTFGVDLSI